MATTWNPSDKSAQITLSNGNLTATDTSTGDSGVRSTTSKNSGKVYVEFTSGATFTGANTNVGVCTAGAPLAGVGNTTVGAFLLQQGGSGAVWFNGSQTGLPQIGQFFTGRIAGMALDFVNMRGWFRVDGVSGNNLWNGNAAFDPAANTGGVDISALFPSNAAWLVFTSNGNGSIATVTPSAFTYTAPSGFTAWDAAALPPVVNPGTFTLNLPVTNGQVVGTMTASNSPTTWTITAGNVGGAWAIDNSGVLAVANAGTVAAGAVSLTVQATNAAGSGIGTAAITVVSLVPVVTSAQFEVVMPATVGQVIGTVTVTGSPTSWTIVSGNAAGAYAISNAGVVTVANPATIVNGVTVLTVQATNASGSGVGTVSLAIPADPPRYLLLVPHYIGGAELAAGAVVAEGVQIPVGWVPTMAVDPQNAEAIQAFWNAGPLPDAEPNRDLYPFSSVKQPVVYWRAVPGVSDYFVLSGAGAALGTKNAASPLMPVIVAGAVGWIYPYMLC